MASSSVVRSIYPDESIPTNVSLPVFIQSSCEEETLKKVSQICADTGKRYKRGEVLDQANRFANCLTTPVLDLHEGDNAAVLLPNIPEYLSIIMGILQAGLVSLLLNPAYTMYELGPMLENLKVKCIVALPSNIDLIKQLVKQHDIRIVITIGKIGNCGYDFYDLIRTSVPVKPSLPGLDTEFNGNKTACVIYSSGTTGTPKGVKLSHINMITQILSSSRVMCSAYGKETMLNIFPRFHLSGAISMFMDFYQCNQSVFLQGKFSTSRYIGAIKTFKPTLMWVVPAMAAIISSSDELARCDFLQLTAVYCSGGVFGETLMNKLRNKLGARTVTQIYYGLTEISGFATCTPLKYCKTEHNSVGIVVPNVEVKVVNTENEMDVGAYEKGEIRVRGPSVFAGYLNNEEASMNAFDSQGWYRTGDIGHFDDRGHFFIDGRIKDIIRVNTFQVSPEEIENIIRKHEKVKEVVVFGIEHEKYGEAPRAIIIRQDSSLTEAEIQVFLKDKLVAYKQLAGGIRFVENLPMTAIGKVIRREAKRLDAIITTGI